MIRLILTMPRDTAAQGLRAAAAAIPDDLAALTSETANDMLAALRAQAPVGKARPGGAAPGGLRSSIRLDLEGTTATFQASQIAQYVIGGTEAHDIEGSPLAFFWDLVGDTVFFMRVRHPGTKPNDFRAPAVDEVAAASQPMLEELGDTIIGRITG